MTENEKLLLDIVTKYDVNEYNMSSEEYENSFLLKELSHIRNNAYGMIDFASGSNLLEVGASYGANTNYFALSGIVIDSIVETEEELCINKTRNKKYNNVNYYLGKYEEILDKLENRYDTIVFSSVGFCSIEELKKIIKKAVCLLNKNGRLYFVIDNKYGLRYWAGRKLSKTGEYFSTLESNNDYGRKTFSKNQITRALDEIGVKKCKWYYPYPDEVFAMEIYTDEFMPKKGSLKDNLKTFGEDKMILFDESKVFDSLIEDGLFAQFANVFMIELRN